MLFTSKFRFAHQIVFFILSQLLLIRHQSFEPGIHDNDKLACSWQFLQHFIKSFLFHIFLHIHPTGNSTGFWFVHSHKENEEIYGNLSGNGKAIIDGEEIILSTGDWLKIAPAAKRQFFASDISRITYICIQVKENSLEHFTAEDAVISLLKVFIYKMHSSR